MKLLFSFIALLFFPSIYNSPPQSFDLFASQFVKGYTALNIANLELSYVAGFEKIKSTTEIQKQLDFFKAAKNELTIYKTGQLSRGQLTDYQLIQYETALNLERLALEEQWAAHRPAKISGDGVITLPNGKNWYAYLLKRWVNADVSPDQIYQFGLTEVKRVQKHIEDIRVQTGLSEDEFYKHLNDPSFFISDPKIVQRSFEHTKDVIYRNMHYVFNQTKISGLKIQKGSNAALAQTPGYYDSNTFYYNLFDKPYNKRQVDWLFIHEAVPGHHYQSSMNDMVKTSAVQQLFYYLGLAEGWAAYTEELGKQLGVYKTPYDELGKWEWDIVRSVRVPMDVGLNYYGWTDEQALAFWKKNVRNQDDIAMREIKRMRRWPAQVVTYKYGALQILHWREELQRKQGKAFNIKDLHSRILDHGSLPLFMVRENVFRTG